MSQPQTAEVGLSNQGATCYLNSLIQTLRNTPEFISELFSVPQQHIFSQNGNIKHDKIVLWEMTKLIARFIFRPKTSLSTKPLTDAFGWNAKELSQQHDVNDLYNILLDGLNQSMPADKKFYQKYYSGKTQTITTCNQCENKSKRIQDFTQLNVNMICSTVNKYHKRVHKYYHKFDHLIGSLVSSFLSTEQLKDNNKYQCNECQAKVKANKICRLIDLPTILILNLNQYHISNGFSVKLDANIICPLSLDMSIFVDHEHVQMDKNIIKQYDLSAIVVHKGGTGSGHYVSYVRCWNNDVTKWCQYNDKIVTTHSEKEIEKLFTSNKKFTPYMIIYRRKYMDNSLAFSIPSYIESAIKVNK